MLVSAPARGRDAAGQSSGSGDAVGGGGGSPSQ